MAVPRQPSSVYRRQAGSAGTLSGTRKDLAIQIEGLSAFRKALREVSPDAEKEFARTLRTYGTRARDRARSRAPVQTGALRKSIKHSVTKTQASVYSNLVYARAHEWGASGQANSQIQPQGVPIAIPKSQMIGNAVYFYRNSLGYDLANLVNKTAKANGIDTGPTVRQSRWGGGKVIRSSN
jgi:phage gpG-like protein